MKTTIKNETAKKQLQTILENEAITDGICTTIKTKDFTCTFHKDLTNDDLTKRAAAFDRACYHEKKINGGFAVQNAMVFILDHKSIARQIEVKAAKNAYIWQIPSWFAYYDGKKLCPVKFTSSDYNYALDVLRI